MKDFDFLNEEDPLDFLKKHREEAKVKAMKKQTHPSKTEADLKENLIGFDHEYTYDPYDESEPP